MQIPNYSVKGTTLKSNIQLLLHHHAMPLQMSTSFFFSERLHRKSKVKNQGRRLGRDSVRTGLTLSFSREYPSFPPWKISEVL